MKRILCLMLCVTLFTSSLFGIKKEAEASVAVTGVAITADVIKDIIFTCMILSGIVEATEDPGTLTLLRGLLESDYQAYYDTLRDNYLSLLHELVKTGQIYDIESSSAFNILLQYDNLDDGAQALADAINQSRVTGIALDGVTPLDFLEGLGFYKTEIMKFDGNDCAIVAPTFVSDLVNDITTTKRLYNDMSDGIQYNGNDPEDITSIRFDFLNPFLDLERPYYNGISLKTIMDEAILEGKCVILNISSSGGIDSLTMYIAESGILLGTANQNSGYNDTRLYLKNFYCYSWNSYTKKTTCSSLITSKYIDSLIINYYYNLSLDGYAIPSENSVDNMAKPIGIAGATSNVLTDAFDNTNANDIEYVEGISGSVAKTVVKENIGELLVIPPFEKVQEKIKDKSLIDGIPSDTRAKVYDETITEELPKAYIPTLDDAITDSLDIPKEDTKEDIKTDNEEDTKDNPPTVNTGWGWLDSLLNAILSVLYDIWMAITGIVSGIVDGILTGLKSLLQWLLDGIKDVLIFLFVPADGYLDTQIVDVTKYFSFFENIIATGKDIGDFFTNEEPEPPSIVVDFSKSDSDINYGGKAVIDFSWYAKYKDDFDDVISAFLWAVFVWNTFRNVSSIINGAGAIGIAKSRVSKSDSKGSEEE